MIRTVTLVALLASAATANAAYSWNSTAQNMMTPSSPGWSYDALVTIGESLPDGFRPVGIPDGIGAYSLNSRTIRAFVNAEVGSSQGYAYSLANGASLTGSRISYFDIDKASKSVVAGGLAYSRIIGRNGSEITASGAGIQRFCSGALFEAGQFQGRGLVDRMYMAGEETGNGTQYALDTATGTLYAVPWMGRAAWENVAEVDTGTTDKVAFIIGDDTNGAPLYLYVGTKQPGGDFLERNGLADGKMYAWKSDAGDIGPSTFNGVNGDNRTGGWVEVTVYDASKAGAAGYDSLGFADQATLTADARSKGAMGFSRPEDVATNPSDGTLVALASTGSGFDNSADTWGTVYTIDVDFDASGNPVDGKVSIVYNGNQDTSRALRSPDNLDWSGDSTLIINEDRSTNWAGAASANPNEASVLLVGLDGEVTRVLEMDRSAVPFGQTDGSPTDFGNWESSGILDISGLFGLSAGRYFLVDVQAHSINLGSTDLVQGGQIAFVTSNVPEPSTWAMLIAGFGIVGFTARRRRAGTPAVSG